MGIDTLGPLDFNIVLDLTENCKCVCKKEAQTAYYSKNQVTIHPYGHHYEEAGKTCSDSVIIVSNDLSMESFVVLRFMEVLFVHLAATYLELETVSRQPFRTISKTLGSQYRYKFSVLNFYWSRHDKTAADKEAGVINTSCHRR